MISIRFWLNLSLATALAQALGCDGSPTESNPADVPLNAEYGKPMLEVDPSAAAKADTFDGTLGPATAGLRAATEVWKVDRRWYETDPAAGLAWPANSKLTWDEKYAAWVDSLPKVEQGWSSTVRLTTPWGKELDAPRLECAETSIFLRATFASWYRLPFFMTAGSGSKTMHFGHFGIVSATGAKVSGFPNFGTAYKDYTAQFAGKTPADLAATWPRDAALRKLALTTLRDDDNSAILGEGAFSGAYFDEIYLNKRVGHFMVRLLTYFGSMHLASSQNTFNLRTTAIRPGDTLLERWQRNGIGHTIVTKHVDHLPGGRLAIDTIFGSMPRIQARWYTTNLSKSYFTSEYTGGPGVNSDGDAYASLGGGLKRWRTGVVKSGRWFNIVPVADRGDFINSTDRAAISARPGQFRVLMGTLSATEQLDVLLERIEVARAGLRTRPASCANRQRREEAFSELYELSKTSFAMTAREVDESYRRLEDYVLPELEYGSSKTCCWNSSTSDMYLIAMQANEAAIQAAGPQCVAPIPFKNNNGYGYFSDYAASIGMASAWRAWSEDEPCAQRAVAVDTEATHRWAPYCTIDSAVLSNE